MSNLLLALIISDSYLWGAIVGIIYMLSKQRDKT